MTKEEKVREWVLDQLENTEVDFDEFEELFIKKFSKRELPLMHEILDEVM